jgi:hypothetical protein
LFNPGAVERGEGKKKMANEAIEKTLAFWYRWAGTGV